MEIFNEIKDANTIIQEMSKDWPAFSLFKIYGSKDNPLYCANDITNLLDIKITSIKNFTNKECITAFVKINDKDEKKILLTEHGLYRILFINNSPLGETFREFIYIILDRLKKYKNVTINEIQEDLIKNNSQELQKANLYLQNKIKSLEYEIDNNSYLLRTKLEDINEKESEIKELYEINSKLKYENKIISQKNIIEFDDMLFKYLKNKYMPCIYYIYYSCDENEEKYKFSQKPINSVLAYELRFENELQLKSYKKIMEIDERKIYEEYLANIIDEYNKFINDLISRQ